MPPFVQGEGVVIDRCDGDFQVSCDACCNDEALSGMEYGTLGEVVEWMKDNGWRSRRNGNSWLHYCPSCVEEGR